jgi:ribonuclease HI
MTQAQRAFLKDGCTSQCINIALNVFEDFKEKQKTGGRLFVLAYDQVKAYDSVQSYTIRASLERFNFPEAFITYVLSNLEDATSCFKTFYGPTEEFSVETSVRQGDPLSPLVYICVTDVLHEGLKSNPLYNNRKMGYVFSNDPRLRVASTGYADDTMTYCESWSEQWMMHEWVRDFCHAHGFRINSKKSKYFISDWGGVNDPRWLPSVDGLDRINPLPGSEPFRYLGLWLSLDLNWGKQIQIMNKCIMDWRWKAFAAKVDPAQLKTSVMDYLLPRLEIGLAHADITEQMCNGWMSTIMFTICRRGGMSSVTNLNRKGFCLLAGLPDIWKRLQTSRATELLVNMNTKYCLSGRTTVARFCSLTGTSASDVPLAVRLLEQKTINKRQNCRLSVTIQYLKKLEINISNRMAGDRKPLLITQDINNTLLVLQRDKKDERITVYTDGSTDPKSNNCNSGCSIIITDSKERPVWSGGMVVRADGNNFIPELAAAATAIKACPIGLPMTLKMDSTAAIGAISKGVVSERKRVRAAGRAWLNFSRQDFMEKRQSIKIQHVFSHKGTASIAQR